MGNTQHRSRRKVLLMISLIVNLGLLSYFKYGEFFLRNFIEIAGFFGGHYQPPEFDIILPVGISFYTFQTLSYCIDVYRNASKPSKSFLDYALYVTFFPQLVAGPIVRSTDFLPQCIRERRADAVRIGWGLTLLTIGIFQKSIIADYRCAPVADQVFGSVADAGFMAAWIGALAFSAQIFFDFSGYSTCAIGIAMCLGFALPDNFRFPYASIGFRDFWRRWHISLSTWLRDYLYISLGGNRKGPKRIYFNIMVTMLIGGLWHGASWRFVLWGGLHGVFLVVERLLEKKFGGRGYLEKTSRKIPAALLTYFLVVIVWVFFRAQDFGGAFNLIGAMLGFSESPDLILTNFRIFRVLGVTVYILASHWVMRDSSLEEMANRVPWPLRSLLIFIMLLSIILLPGDNRAFIYFQF